MKSYRFLLFDADYTLLDFDRDMERAFQATYKACFGSQRPYSPQLLEQYEACNNRWWAKLERGECTKPQLYAGRFQDFLRETGLSGDPEEINRAYFANLGQGGALLPGALELVRDLSQRYRLVHCHQRQRRQPADTAGALRPAALCGGRVRLGGCRGRQAGQALLRLCVLPHPRL